MDKQRSSFSVQEEMYVAGSDLQDLMQAREILHMRAVLSVQSALDLLPMP